MQEQFTLQQQAAISLGVPSSGVEWLDDMIRESNAIKTQRAIVATQSSLAIDRTGSCIAKRTIDLVDGAGTLAMTTAEHTWG